MASRLSFNDTDDEDTTTDDSSRLMSSGTGAKASSASGRRGKATPMATAITVTSDNTWGDFDADGEDGWETTEPASLPPAAATTRPSPPSPTLYDFDNGQPANAPKRTGGMRLSPSTNREVRSAPPDDDGSILTLDDSALPRSPGGLRHLRSDGSRASPSHVHAEVTIPEIHYDDVHEVESPTEYQLFQRVKALSTGAKIICFLHLLVSVIVITLLNGKAEEMKFVAIAGFILAPIGLFAAFKMHRFAQLAYLIGFAAETVVYIILGFVAFTQANENTDWAFYMTLILVGVGKVLPIYYLHQFWRIMPPTGMQAFAKFQTSSDMLDLV